MTMMQTKKLSDDGLDAIGEEIRERSAREEKRLKYRQTMVYCGTYVAQGLAGGCIGPTLLLLAANTSSTVDDMGLIFTLRGLGWIVGSLCAGRLYESTGKRSHAVLFGSTMTMAAFLLVFPFARSLWLLLALQAVNAFFASFNDVGANTLMFQVWQRQVAPYMQFLHFSYGVGSTSAPAIIALVLLVAPSDAQLLWCYWVLGFLVMLPSFFALAVPSPAPIAAAPAPDLDASRNNGSQDAPKWLGHLIIFLTAFSLFTYVGIEIAYGGWIFTYAVNEFHMGETEADYLSSAFWLAITIGRLLAVPLATRFSSRSMLLTDHIGSTLAIILAIVVVPFKNNFSLWVVTLLYGVFMASIYALVFSFPYQLGVAITSRASSLLVVGSSLGAMLVPMGAGFIFNKIAASLLMWTILAGNLVLLAVYALLALFLPRCMGITVTAHAAGATAAIKNSGDDDDEVAQMMKMVDEEDDDDHEGHHASSRRKAHRQGKGAFELVPLGLGGADDHP